MLPSQVSIIRFAHYHNLKPIKGATNIIRQKTQKHQTIKKGKNSTPNISTTTIEKCIAYPCITKPPPPEAGCQTPKTIHLIIQEHTRPKSRFIYKKRPQPPSEQTFLHAGYVTLHIAYLYNPVWTHILFLLRYKLDPPIPNRLRPAAM